MNQHQAQALVSSLDRATGNLSVVNMGWRVRVNMDTDVVSVQWVDLVRGSVVKTISSPSDRIVDDVTRFVSATSATMVSWDVEYISSK